jgi:hypothetical protein
MRRAFTLRRIIWADPEDFSVREGDRAVGRIYHTTGGERGGGYAWFIFGNSRAGFAETLDEAKAEWKGAYTRWQTERLFEACVIPWGWSAGRNPGASGALPSGMPTERRGLSGRQ